MAYTVIQWTDKLIRRVPGLDPGDGESIIPVALKRLSRAAQQEIFRPSLSTELSLTLGAADAYGVQSVSIASSNVVDESLMVINSVRHSDIASIGPLILVKSLAHLLPPHIYSASVYGYYFVEGRAVYCRRPLAALATSSGALKAFGVSLLSAVTAIPNALEGVFEDLCVSILMERGQPNRPATPDEVAA